MPALALTAGIAGAGISGIGAVEAGQATANAANYSAEVARNNATIANQNADYSIAAGQRKTADTSMKNAANIGRIRGAQAASGIDVNSGSAEDVQVGNRETGQLDSETVLNNSELQAYGYRSQSTGFTAQAGLDTMTAEQAPIGSDIGAGGSLLSNASSLGFKWSTSNPTA